MKTKSKITLFTVRFHTSILFNSPSLFTLRLVNRPFVPHVDRFFSSIDLWSLSTSWPRFASLADWDSWSTRVSHWMDESFFGHCSNWFGCSRRADEKPCRWTNVNIESIHSIIDPRKSESDRTSDQFTFSTDHRDGRSQSSHGHFEYQSFFVFNLSIFDLSRWNPCIEYFHFLVGIISFSPFFDAVEFVCFGWIWERVEHSSRSSSVSHWISRHSSGHSFAIHSNSIDSVDTVDSIDQSIDSKCSRTKICLFFFVSTNLFH